MSKTWSTASTALGPHTSSRCTERTPCETGSRARLSSSLRTSWNRSRARASRARTRSGERIAQLDGEATGDPTSLLERSLFRGFELPTKYTDIAEIMRIGLDHVRSLIRAYGELLDATRKTDELSHRLVGPRSPTRTTRLPAS
jgi:hypothetical protein